MSIEETMSLLKAAGWSPSRAIDISAQLAIYAKYGIEIFPAAEACLRSFGGLMIHNPPEPRKPGAFVAFDLEDAVGNGTASTLDRTAARLGATRLVPIGSADFGRSLLYIDSGGRLFTQNELGDFALFGMTPIEALNRLLHNSTPLQIIEW